MPEGLRSSNVRWKAAHRPDPNLGHGEPDEPACHQPLRNPSAEWLPLEVTGALLHHRRLCPHCFPALHGETPCARCGETLEHSSTTVIEGEYAVVFVCGSCAAGGVVRLDPETGETVDRDGLAVEEPAETVEESEVRADGGVEEAVILADERAQRLQWHRVQLDPDTGMWSGLPDNYRTVCGREIDSDDVRDLDRDGWSVVAPRDACPNCHPSRDGNRPELATDGGRDSITCYDCERAFGRAAVGFYDVPVPNDEDGLGYEMVPVPLCRDCQLRRYGVKCQHCGEYHADAEAVFECQRDNPRLVPDGGRSHVGPISFTDETARRQLVEHGEVVTFRPAERTTGRTWWRVKRGGKKQGEVDLSHLESVSTRHPDGAFEHYLDRSGFASVADWFDAIRDLHGSLPEQGHLYLARRPELAAKEATA